MSIQTFVMDSRLPVSDTLSLKDPNHPRNVMRSAILIANQASADTKYDIYPPPRVEGFADFSQNNMILLCCILLVILGLYFAITLRHTVFRVAFAILAMYAIHNIVVRL